MANSSTRPLSPHLSIYRMQPSMVMSGLHRITGFALTIGLVLLTWWLVAAAVGPAYFQYVQGIVGSWIGKLALLGWTFSIFYHLGTGIRHLNFDVGLWLDKDGIDRSGWAAVALGVAGTVVTWAAGCAMLYGK